MWTFEKAFFFTFLTLKKALKSTVSSRRAILVCFIRLHLVCASNYVYEKKYDILVCLSDCIWYVHLTMKYDIYWCAYQIAFGMCI